MAAESQTVHETSESVYLHGCGKLQLSFKRDRVTQVTQSCGRSPRARSPSPSGICAPPLPGGLPQLRPCPPPTTPCFERSVVTSEIVWTPTALSTGERAGQSVVGRRPICYETRFTLEHRIMLAHAAARIVYKLSTTTSDFLTELCQERLCFKSFFGLPECAEVQHSWMTRAAPNHVAGDCRSTCRLG